ncbi:MAG: hypothetical protein VE99_C0003G0019 [candidate division Kazan bacterium GW2011_GWC1_52_13]|uniref:Uncharacterized protein n=1 Tax=candidate division Kazan bacterium GW2011_GWB1_52_7 TaxID=1620414 RepID=A0A0G1X630_UNCK3|nr:MAG: hypothetical protein VE99_C0003G0019 [candidate division Kazan bacterium GW2011_GWC1_52_13]KKW26275.1 MAG: hypothetical protein VF00_C0013G0012 [candidate division Kazan bacterium GW2011_GWB1_52_7]
MKILRLRVWLSNLLLVFWLAISFIFFRFWAIVIILPLIAAWGLGLTTLGVFLAYGIWSTVFYLLILRGTVFDRARARLASLVPKKENRFFSWVKRTFLKKEQVLLPPWVILVNFAILGVLSSVLLVRLSYPKSQALKGLGLIWVGCAVEVLTWFLPVYGGLAAAFSTFLREVLGIAF